MKSPAIGVLLVRAPVVALAVIALGCGGGGPTNNTSASGGTTTASAASSPANISASTGRTPSSDSVVPTVAANVAANGESADDPKPQSQATGATDEPEVRAAEPAFATQAVELIDLRKIARLNEAREMQAGQTHVWYMSKSSVAGASAYYRAELGAKGWKEVTKQVASQPTPEYDDVTFTKNDFYLRVSIGATGDEGVVSINLTNNGNVDTTRLPKYPEAREIPVDPTNANYRTSAEMQEVIDFCRKELAALGWHEYTGFSPDPTDVPHAKLLRHLKNAVQLDVSISDVSKFASPDFPDAKTHVAYMLTGMIDHDMPIRPDATNMKLDIYPWRMKYETPASTAEVVEFYRSAYPKLGWSEEEAAAQVTEKSATLVFTRSDDEHFLIGIGRSDEGLTTVQFNQVSIEKPDTPKQPVAKSNPAKTDPDREPVAVRGNDDPKPAKKKDSLGEKLGVPTTAKNVSRDSNLGMISFTSSDDAQKVAEYYRKALPDLGWREVKLASSVQKEFASLTFEKGDDTLIIAVLDGKPESRTRTIIQGESLWPDEDADAKPTPAKNTKPIDSDTPKAQPKPKKDHEKLPNKGLITIGDKTYKLENVVAFSTKYADSDVTAIVMTEKPVQPNKLKAALKKKPPSDDFVDFQPHVKLIFDESDKLIYYFIYADGVSINRGGTPDPEEVTATGNVSDGYASGKVAMLKAGEFFDRRFRFEVTFYAPIENVRTPAPSEPEPEPGTLVAEDYEGLPIPDNTSNRSSEGSPFRKTIVTTVPADLKATLEFYRRELPSRGWKETETAAKIEPDQAKLAFTGKDGALTLSIERKGKESMVELSVRYAAKAKAAGIAPQPNRAKLMLGNASDKPVVILINNREYKVAAGVGSTDPKSAISIDVDPGTFVVKLKPADSDDEPTELKIGPDETWGVIVFPTGGLFSNQLY